MHRSMQVPPVETLRHTQRATCFFYVRTLGFGGKVQAHTMTRGEYAIARAHLAFLSPRPRPYRTTLAARMNLHSVTSLWLSCPTLLCPSVRASP